MRVATYIYANLIHNVYYQWVSSYVKKSKQVKYKIATSVRALKILKSLNLWLMAVAATFEKVQV